MPEGMSHPWGRPGDLLRHPVALIALGAWLLNDHVLKATFGNGLTGKLSDAAGLVVFPLLLLSLVHWVAPGPLRKSAVQRRFLALAVVVTGGILIVLNVSPRSAVWVYDLVTLLQWPFVSGLALIQGEALPGWVRVSGTVDPTDLWTLPFLGIPVVLVLRRGHRRVPTRDMPSGETGPLRRVGDRTEPV